jgi:hypothetical protein
VKSGGLKKKKSRKKAALSNMGLELVGSPLLNTKKVDCLKKANNPL